MPTQSANRTKWVIILSVIVFLAVALTIGLVNYFLLVPDIALEFLPKGNTKYPLIWINRADELKESPWANELHKFIEKYRDKSSGNGDHCSFRNEKKSTEKSFCFVDVQKMKGCVETPQDKFGYAGGITKPCILLKLNQVPNWTPVPYTLEDLAVGIPTYMDKDVIERITSLNKTQNELQKRELNTVWISCDGTNSVDRESIGPLRFFSPGIESENFAGIPGYYFPFQNQEGYQEPFVFVRFENPRMNILINVICKAWAKNINEKGFPDIGYQSLEFQLLID